MKKEIEAKDLRIGNYVYIGDFRFSVTSIEDMGDEYHINGYRLNRLSPIPLTPEILQKAGFHYGSGNSCVARLEIAYEDSDYPCSLQISGSGVCIARSGIGAITAPVFYLHQLQNIYFALTNKELIISL